MEARSYKHLKKLYEEAKEEHRRGYHFENVMYDDPVSYRNVKTPPEGFSHPKVGTSFHLHEDLV